MADAPEQPEELIVTLRKQVSLGDLSVSQLVLREPTAAEWQQFDQLTGVAGDIKAVSVVSGVAEPLVRQIGARDLTKASRYLAGFLI